MGSSGSSAGTESPDPSGGPSRTCRLLSFGRSSEEALPPPHPLAVQLAAQKRSQAPRKPRYQKLVQEATASVPEPVQQQIRIDIPRTFSALPSGRRGDWGWAPVQGWPPVEAEAEAVKVREAKLTRVLLSHEWRAMDMKPEGRRRDDPEACTYVQGINLMAAMCLGFVGGREEECFWLLLHVTEDVLSRGFFSKSPPLFRYHGDKSATASLVASQAPRLTFALGAPRIAEAVTMLTDHCFLAGFVGCLAPGPLLAFWEDLLSIRHVAYPRFPLLEWLVGLICLAEDELVQIANSADGPELGPLFFMHVQKVGRTLRDEWRPNLNVPDHRIQELRKISDEAAQKHGQIHEEQAARESHAKSARASLDRQGQSSARLLDLVQSAGALQTTVSR